MFKWSSCCWEWKDSSEEELWLLYKVLEVFSIKLKSINLSSLGFFCWSKRVCSSTIFTVVISSVFSEKNSNFSVVDFPKLKRGLPFVSDLEVWPWIAFPFLRIDYGLDTGVIGDSWGFSLVLILLGARMNLWSRQIDGYNQLKMSNLCLSSKISSVSYPRKAELEFRFPDNDTNLLSLQETP